MGDERIEETERLRLAVARLEVDCAELVLSMHKRTLDDLMQRIAREYKLGEHDRIDGQSGAIVRMAALEKVSHG